MIDRMAIEMKNMDENTSAIPVKRISIETKKGLREYAKMPFITNFPLFEASSPKRSESLKESNVKHIETTPNNMMINPGNETQTELCMFLLINWGKIETVIICA